MSMLTAILALGAIVLGPPEHPRAWSVFPGEGGPGERHRIVLISGDEEYRSEEALPQLAAILSTRHGFDCVVLYAIGADGMIDPDHRANIPGLGQLATADLAIIATRFRDLPDGQMAHIDGYLRAGKPVIGLRTATHAFNLSSPTYAHYTWNHAGHDNPLGGPGGFGRQILGETWIAHHGAHGRESTRGLVAPDARDHPIARGLRDADIWGPTDVYRVRLPLPEARTPVVLGQVLAGMTPDAEPLDTDKNDPLMPIAWTGAYAVGDGPRGRVFTTTMGAATDLVAPGTRLMLVNAVYWALGLEERIPGTGCDARPVGDYRPTAFGFGGFVAGRRPTDFGVGPTEDEHGDDPEP